MKEGITRLLCKLNFSRRPRWLTDFAIVVGRAYVLDHFFGRLASVRTVNKEDDCDVET